MIIRTASEIGKSFLKNSMCSIS